MFMQPIFTTLSGIALQKYRSAKKHIRYPALKTKSERVNSILFGLAIIVAEFFIFSKIIVIF